MQDSIYISYWTPYSYAGHQDLVARLQMLPQVSLEILGSTLDDRDLDLLRIGKTNQRQANFKSPCDAQKLS